MSIDRNDPRLTAYALGEMDETERAAFEAQLDDEARREVAAIRALAGKVEGALAAEPAPALREDQRRAVAAAAAKKPRRLFWPVATAATLLLAVGFGMMSVTLNPPARHAPPMVVAEKSRAAERAEQHERLQRELTRIAGIETATVSVLEPAANQFQFAAEVARAPEHDTEAYDRIVESGFRRVADRDVSTFSIDVDTAAYANVRRFLMQQNQLPPKDAVRIEELVNYFRYDYAGPEAWSEHPFATHVEAAACPWNARHRLVRVALQGRRIETKERPASNLVFLLDVSGSMEPANKLPLLQRGLRLLVEQLDARDRVAIVVYAGASGLVLPPTAGDRKAEIRAALDDLKAGGSTNGGAGIELAYRVAQESFLEGGVNRVVLATDGDFNVGVTDRGSLTRLIEEKAKTGVFLSILGFGTGNYKDATMEDLSNRGNGNYAYVDTLNEAKKVLVDQMTGTLVTIAKDVKIQVFFNPKTVEGWRLVGYENRLLRAEDFNDDTKDAGEIGAGHAVTAFYEIVPKGVAMPGPSVDPNPFVEKEREPSPVADAGALLQLRLRYKRPDGDESILLQEDVRDPGGGFDEASPEYRFAAAVASFGMLLRDSPHRGEMGWDAVREIAASAIGPDVHGYRGEFLELVDRAKQLAQPK